MSFRSILRDVRDGLGNLSRRRRARSTASANVDFEDEEEGNGHDRNFWATLPPELLREVVKSLLASDNVWPARKNLVACAGVCRSWRQMCKEVVGKPETTAKITFPVQLKQPGSRTEPIQCYIRRNKSSSTYCLYLGLDTENGKFLMAAKKFRRPTRAEFIISSNSHDISRNSVSYMGKLSSNFLGTKFAIYDSLPPYSGAVTSLGRSSRRFYSRKVSPKLPSGSYGIANIDYELNMLGSRGPRRLCCTMHSIPTASLEPDGTVPSYPDFSHSLEDSFSAISFSHSMDRHITSDFRFSDSSRFTGSTRFSEISVDVVGVCEPLVLKNKAPRWHEQLQCWCLNFHGRVTVASVKNFQLTAAPQETPNNAGQTSGSSDQSKIILQFGKIGKDLFTMDYHYPLSAFQAFGICLSSFDNKMACE